jgi:peptidoglycan-associated lipoprotein
MRKQLLGAAAAAIVTALVATARPAVAASGYKAIVYPDRTNPDLSVAVDSFRVNETVWDEGGVRYIRVGGPAGHFQVPFSHIRQIEFERYVGADASRPDWAWYDVKVTGVKDDEIYAGRLEIRVMRGVAAGVPWYSYPSTDADRGRLLYRIVFGAVTVPPTIPWEAPTAPAELPPVAIVVAKPSTPVVARPSKPVTPPPSEDDLFAKLTVDDVSRQKPLEDVFFDFDRSDLRPDGEEALLRNAAWLKRWPSVRVRIEGCADPRGTNEYNLGLGMRRADTVRAFLLAQGVALTRVDVLSIGESQLVCNDQTEACWARNRTGRFAITDK